MQRALLVAALIAVVAAQCPNKLNNCWVFPPNDEWNRPIDQDPVDYMSPCIIANITDNYGASSGKNASIHLDFGLYSDNPEYGIGPAAMVTSATPLQPINFYDCDTSPPPCGTTTPPDCASYDECYCESYGDESDDGPFPIPMDTHVEGAFASNPSPQCGDRHVLSVNTDTCMLYELYASQVIGGQWYVASSAKWNLSRPNDVENGYQRPVGYTSADAAGLPIFPGLLRYSEYTQYGSFSHAIRGTFRYAQMAYTSPGSHYGTKKDVNTPPYGARFRLKANYPETGYTGAALAIVKTLKKYGIMYADQGSNMYISGTSDDGWDTTNTISQINGGVGGRKIRISDFEVVQSRDSIHRGFTPNPSTVTCKYNGLSSNPAFPTLVPNECGVLVHQTSTTAGTTGPSTSATTATSTATTTASTGDASSTATSATSTATGTSATATGTATATAGTNGGLNNGTTTGKPNTASSVHGVGALVVAMAAVVCAALMMI